MQPFYYFWAMGLFGKMFVSKSSDEMITNKINDFQGTVMAEGDNNQLFAGCYIVNEFKFIRLVLIGEHKLKSLDGADAIISTDKDDIELESDCTEIETENSATLNKSITSIEFNIDDELEKMILGSELKTISISVKKNKYQLDFVNPAKFKEALTASIDLDVTVEFEEEE